MRDRAARRRCASPSGASACAREAWLRPGSSQPPAGSPTRRRRRARSGILRRSAARRRAPTGAGEQPSGPVALRSAPSRGAGRSSAGTRRTPGCTPSGRRTPRRAIWPPAGGGRPTWWRTTARARGPRARTSRRTRASSGSRPATRRPIRRWSARVRGPAPDPGNSRTSAYRCRKACSASARSGTGRSARGRPRRCGPARRRWCRQGRHCPPCRRGWTGRCRR
jgi:hypothetical protein